MIYVIVIGLVILSPIFLFVCYLAWVFVKTFFQTISPKKPLLNPEEQQELLQYIHGRIDGTVDEGDPVFKQKLKIRE